jgi:vacuolar-type H+-ATPase subunit F/Vma7
MSEITTTQDLTIQDVEVPMDADERAEMRDRLRRGLNNGKIIVVTEDTPEEIRDLLDAVQSVSEVVDE